MKRRQQFDLTQFDAESADIPHSDTHLDIPQPSIKQSGVWQSRKEKCEIENR